MLAIYGIGIQISTPTSASLWIEILAIQTMDGEVSSP
jgi:hypothetical protein